MSADNFDEVAQLQAKVAMLASALRKMDTDCAHRVKLVANDLTDCAACFTEYAEWHGALYEAIGKFAEQGEEDLNDLSFADTHTVKQLAAIGCYLADGGMA